MEHIVGAEKSDFHVVGIFKHLVASQLLQSAPEWDRKILSWNMHIKRNIFDNLVIGIYEIYANYI